LEELSDSPLGIRHWAESLCKIKKETFPQVKNKKLIFYCTTRSTHIIHQFWENRNGSYPSVWLVNGGPGDDGSYLMSLFSLVKINLTFGSSYLIILKDSVKKDSPLLVRGNNVHLF
jgi:hypothetical protein